jgi:hypothetical protein
VLYPLLNGQNLALSFLNPFSAEGYGVYTSLEKPKRVVLAPLAPQFWGELDYILGFLPPNLGGRGGQCRLFEITTHLGSL